MIVNLVLLKKDGKKKSFTLERTVTVLGRGGDCDLRIPIETVSKKHCQLSLDGQILKIRDLGSRNGTSLNDKEIKEEMVINAGDSIKIGPLKFILQIDGKPEKIELSNKMAPKTSQEDTFSDSLDKLDELGQDFGLDSSINANNA